MLTVVGALLTSATATPRRRRCLHGTEVQRRRTDADDRGVERDTVDRHRGLAAACPAHRHLPIDRMPTQRGVVREGLVLPVDRDRDTNRPGSAFDAVTSARSGAGVSTLMSYGACRRQVSLTVCALSSPHARVPRSIRFGRPSGIPGVAGAAGADCVRGSGRTRGVVAALHAWAPRRAVALPSRRSW